MIYIIFLAVMGLSLIGLGFILYRKIPILLKLTEPPSSSGEPLIAKIKKGALQLPGAERFNYELYLQKILSRVRVLTIKTENQTSGWLEKLRQRANQKNNHNNDSYWEELKKTKKGK